MPALSALSMMTEALEASCGARISTLIPWEIRFSHWATCFAASLSVTWTRRSIPFFLAAASIVCLSFTQRSSRCVGSESPTFGPAASARGAARTRIPAHAARSALDAFIPLLQSSVVIMVLPLWNVVRHCDTSITLHGLKPRLDPGGRLGIHSSCQLHLQLHPPLSFPGVVAVLRRILSQEGEDHAAAPLVGKPLHQVS